MRRTALLGLMLAILLLGCFIHSAKASETTAPLTAAPNASPEATPAPASTSAPSSPSALAPTPFSLVWVPDTQDFSYYFPENYFPLAAYINDHRESDNILGVIHTGDMVDNGFKQWQWDNFYPFLDALDPALFFFPVAGNHDIGVRSSSYYGYLAQPFLNDYPEEQKYGGGKLLYRILSEGGVDILLLGVGWDTWKEPAAMRWLDDVLAAHGDLPCLMVVHGFVRDAKQHFAFVEKIVAQHPTIRLVISGHMRNYCNRVYEYDDDGDGATDRIVNGIMLNLQDWKTFAFRIMTFDPLARSVTFTTLNLDGSPVADIPDLGPVDFTLENAF